MKYIHNNVVLLLKKQTKKTKTNIKQKVKTNSIFHDLRIIITNFKRVEEVFFLFFLTNCTHHKMSASLPFTMLASYFVIV